MVPACQAAGQPIPPGAYIPATVVETSSYERVSAWPDSHPAAAQALSMQRMPLW